MRNPVLLGEVGKRGRRSRRPQHTFLLKSNPYTIQPFLLAPVLPGESMDNLLMQSRCVTDPIANPLIGWWLEYYFFYVKHRDLEQIDGFAGEFQSMMLDPSWVDDNVDDATASAPYYFFANGINWSKLCLQRVVEEYFRNEGEAWTSYVDSNGLPIASINTDNWAQSLLLDQTVAAADDVDVDLDADSTITAGEIDAAMRQWLLLRENNLTDMSYDDYLRTFGVRTSREESHVPELLRYVKNWQYPSNTVNASDGSVASAVSWSVTERADKRRFFKEPGFIFGVTVARPKVYFRKMVGSAACSMNTMLSWLPAMLRGDVNIGMQKMDFGTGMVPTVGDSQIAGPANDDYWFDVRDLLLYGDQFVNFDHSSTATDNMVDLPDTNANRRYVDTADMQGLFAGSSYNVRQDGVVNLNIASAESKDYTPATPNVTV